MNLTELKKNPYPTCLKWHRKWAFENLARSRKQDVIFAILKKRQEW